MVYVSIGQKELRKDYPFKKGLTKGTETQEGRQMNLVPQGLLGVRSIVLRKDKTGF